jgi:uncharacterized protein YciI
MLFIATCTDKPDSTTTRRENRPAHLAYLGAHSDRVKAGGALLTPDQSSVLGSLLIIEAVDEAEVATLLAEDPYAKAQLFATIDIKPWRQAVGAPLA